MKLQQPPPKQHGVITQGKTCLRRRDSFKSHSLCLVLFAVFGSWQCIRCSNYGPRIRTQHMWGVQTEVRASHNSINQTKGKFSQHNCHMDHNRAVFLPAFPLTRLRSAALPVAALQCRHARGRYATVITVHRSAHEQYLPPPTTLSSGGRCIMSQRSILCRLCEQLNKW
jgi:hypothetical protein